MFNFKKTLIIILFLFILIPNIFPLTNTFSWKSFYQNFFDNVFPTKSITQINNSGEILLGDIKPTDRTFQNWKSAINTTEYKGISWIGKLQSNGINDEFKREEKGRDTIIFAPYTDFSKPIDIIYYFHGIQGFCDMGNDPFNSCHISDMKDRIILQSDILVNRGRNIVIVFPEMPWSAGTAKDDSRRKNRQSALIWTTEDSDLAQLHKDVLDVIKTKFNENTNITINSIEMTGHSAGGAAIAEAALRPSIQNNYLSQIKPNILKLSDADYCWNGGNAATNIYQNYLKENNAKLYLMVQNPKLSSAHEPTANAILFYNNINSIACNIMTDAIKKQAPKVTLADNIVPNTNNKVIYIPLNKGHLEIGKMSLAYYTVHDIESTSNKLALGNKDLLFPLTNESFYYISYNFAQHRKPTNSIPYVRCHGGTDIYTKGPATVQAITDGEIIHLYNNFANCDGGQGAAIYIYHANLNQTILYGEINAKNIAINPRTGNKWAKGDKINKGDILGKASVCGMLHLEVHDGLRSAENWSYDSGSWKPKGTYSYSNCIANVPENLENPKSFLTNLISLPQNQYIAQVQTNYETRVA
jgi:hypothetical protein